MRPLFRQLRRDARQHWLFVALATAGLGLRVVTQIAYRPALLYIDSYRYLEVFRSLDPTKTQPIGYDLFVLRPVLWLGNLAAVAALQHVLGLAMGVAIYVLLLRCGSARWLAVLAAAPILLDAYQLQIEQNIMSETIFEAFVLAGVVLLLWWRSPSYWVFVVAGVLFGFAVPVRILGGVVIVPAIAYALVAGDGGWPRLRRAGALALAFAFPVLAYTAAYSFTEGRVGINRGDAELLYGRAATIVEHCHALGLPSYELELCPKEPLGHRFGPNAYAHDLPYKQRVVPPPGKTKDAVLRDFARRVITKQPLDFANAVLHDFVKTFAWGRTTSRGDPTVDRWQFQHGYPTFPPRHTDPGVTIDQYGGGGPTVVRSLASFLRGYQLSVGFTPGPVLALAFIIGLLGAGGIGRARRSGLRAPCALPTLCALALLLTADVFEFSWRYQLPALTLAPLGGALGVTALMGWRADAAATPATPGETPSDEPAAVDVSG